VWNLRATDVIWDDWAAASLENLVEPPEVYWKMRGQLNWN
jgi:hypothetical protein